jgi:Fe-S-cluster containining protein
MVDLDHALYLLNFANIQLGLTSNGDWSVYYTYPCRFLDRQTFRCTVHNTPKQPQICINYNPYSCWYKRTLTKSFTADFLRIDRPRLEWIASQLRFDETRQIVEVPDWALLLEGIANLPLAEPTPPNDPPASDLALDSWQQLVRQNQAGTGSDAIQHNYDSGTDPCSSCAAYCCSTLVFPHPAPSTRASLDFLRFCLGFPGIELGVSDGVWSLVVKTSCRHLSDNRCTIFGQPERPLICRYYDAWKCSYKPRFGLPRPPGFVRLRLEHFDALSEGFVFDDDGNVVHAAPFDALRNHIEQRWQIALVSA